MTKSKLKGKRPKATGMKKRMNEHLRALKKFGGRK